MRLPVLILTAAFALALTDSGFAQATLPNDDVNSANNPGSVRETAPVGEQSLDCTCHSAPSAAAPIGDTGSGDQIVHCGCHETAPDTTGTIATPLSPKAAAGSIRDGAAPSR